MNKVDLIYQDFVNYKDQKSHSKTNKDEPHLIYGEITREGIEKIVNEINFSPNDVVLDIGSGRGKGICHLSLITNVKKLIGIEIMEERHNLALSLANSGDYDNVEFLCKDIFDCLPIIEDSTIIIANLLAFPKDLAQKLLEMIPKGKTIILSTTLNINFIQGSVRELPLSVSWVNKEFMFYVVKT